VQQTLRLGFRAGFSVTVASALVGLVMLILITATGIRSIFGSPVFHLYMGLVGGVSMVLLACLTGKEALSSLPTAVKHHVETSYSSTFFGGIVVNAANPLAYIWWAVVGIPSLGVANELAGFNGMYLWAGGILVALFLWYGGISFLVSRGMEYLPVRAIRGISLISSIFLAIFGAFLLFHYVVQP
jgi:threonine/homoserine/homoserine lactone efflux protein